MSYKLAIVDDSFQIITALTNELSQFSDIEIVVKAKNGQDFLAQLRGLQPEQLPHLALMDIDMPLLNGIETVRVSSVLYESMKYIMLTVFDDDDTLFEAIKAGADGYLLKEEQPLVILRAIKEVMEHEGAPMSPRIARKTFEFLTNKQNNSSDAVPTNLSQREMDILKGLYDGLDYKQIASRLIISPFTVRNHITAIYDKLHVSSKTEAVKLAIKNKWM
ncbi:MAG: response regulator transcription factor [Sediminibacterium sp.]|nr:response regulator transcription factor [Sediminibacterium sp.]MBX9781115.1 response regulator transcription factor [Chitinophagaceae bacterium]